MHLFLNSNIFTIYNIFDKLDIEKMNKKQILIPILILILVVIGIYLFSKISEEEIIETPRFNLNNDIDIQIRDMSKVSSEFYSGNSRFSKGLCSQDTDCDAQGCSKEICTSQEGVMSTCEVLENAPDKDHHACGCIKDTCGWYLKN